MSENQPGNIFPTFCHITEYEEEGYGALHRMIASSYPLVLWSPSGTMLEKYSEDHKCHVNVSDMKNYVESGYVKIIFRESWKCKKYRNSRNFWGVHWHEEFDDFVTSIERNDISLPDSKQRVRVVEEEDGYDKADEFMTNCPDDFFDYIWWMIETNKITKGSIDKAKKHQDNKRMAVREVLRDARNHSRAIQLADKSVTATPFLSGKDINFFRTIDSAPGDYLDFQIEKSTDLKSIDVYNEFMNILAHFESIGSTIGFKEYLGSDHHKEISKFLNAISNSVKKSKPEDIYADLLSRIEADIEQRDNTIANMNKFYKFMNLNSFSGFGSLCTSVIDALAGGLHSGILSALKIGGIVFTAVPLGRGFLRKIGFLTGDYHLPHWSSLYTFGKQYDEYSKEKIIKLIKLLKEGNGYVK